MYTVSEYRDVTIFSFSLYATVCIFNFKVLFLLIQAAKGLSPGFRVKVRRIRQCLRLNALEVSAYWRVCATKWLKIGVCVLLRRDST